MSEGNSMEFWSKVKQDQHEQVGWYAPGDYMNHCRECKCHFIGDKRAGHCYDCAVKLRDLKEKEATQMTDPLKTLAEECVDKLHYPQEDRHFNVLTIGEALQQAYEMGRDNSEANTELKNRIYELEKMVDFYRNIAEKSPPLK